VAAANVSAAAVIVILLVTLTALDHLEDYLEVEAAALQETHLARAVRGAAWLPAAELPAPNLARRFQLAPLQLGERGRDRVVGYPLLKQVALDAPRSVTFSERVHPLLHHPALGHPAAALEVIEHTLDFTRILGVDRQLPCELGP